MPKNVLTLIKEGDFSEWRLYKLGDGRRVRMHLSDSFDEVSIETEDGRRIGKIEFDARDDENSYKIVWGYLDWLPGFTHCGIGRQALLYFQDISGAELTAADNDGHRRDDGSHLTQDAPGFIAAMRREGVVRASTFEAPDDE